MSIWLFLLIAIFHSLAIHPMEGKGGAEERGCDKVGGRKISTPKPFLVHEAKHDTIMISARVLASDGLESAGPRTLSNASLDAYKTQP